jgi:hypothetical protein
MPAQNYKVHTSSLIIDNQQEFIDDAVKAIDLFKDKFPGKDSTWDYRLYNTFAITSPSLVYYKLFDELKTIIREFVDHDRPLWMQSWINFHGNDQLLQWHQHAWPVHGYISIDPKVSSTVFETHFIENKVGNIYIGLGGIAHKVQADIFDGRRITIGFDVAEDPHNPDGQFNLIPI